MRHLLDNHVEHLVGDVFNLVDLLLLLQPLQHLILVLEVALVHHRNPLLKVEHRRHFFNAVLLRFFRVVDLHERHAELIALVVNVLQLVENPLRLAIVVVVCDRHKYIPNIIHIQQRSIRAIFHEKLTEKYSQGFSILDKTVQHLVGDVLDLVLLELRQQPLQNFILVLDVTCNR